MGSSKQASKQSKQAKPASKQIPMAARHEFGYLRLAQQASKQSSKQTASRQASRGNDSEQGKTQAGSKKHEKQFSPFFTQL